MYKLFIDPITNRISEKMIIRTYDNFSIPFDDNNTDYQAYLAWLDEGNTPEPADEVI